MKRDFLFRIIICLLFFLSTNCSKLHLNNPQDPFTINPLLNLLLNGAGSFFGAGAATQEIVTPPLISNAINLSTLSSGFLIGTATTEVKQVEVSIDNGSYVAASGSSNWKFAIPSGSITWTNGSYHTLKVRGKNQNGDVSSDTTIRIKKGRNKDINGDGYPDLVIGAKGLSKVYIFYGSKNGISSKSSADADLILNGVTVSDNFGSSISLGDINSDGFADICVGAFMFSSGTGQIYIFYGNSSGISILTASTAATKITGVSATDNAGNVAVGDINRDGYDDLAIGAVGVASSTGAVYLFHGSSNGILTGLTTSAITTLTGFALSDSFGTSITISDINGDGFAEVIVGAFSANSNTGGVYVFNGSSSGITSANSSLANSIILGTASVGQVGGSLSANDVNGDGKNDFLIGGIGVNGGLGSNQGQAFLFYGQSNNFGSITTSSASSTFSGAAANDAFGTVGMDDLNCDGYADIFIGARGRNSNIGQSYVFLSQGTSGVSTALASSANFTQTGIVTGDLLGYVTGTDINGDGYADLIVGSPNRDAGQGSFNQGEVYIFKGRASGSISASASAADTILTGVIGGNNHFGQGLPN